MDVYVVPCRRDCEQGRGRVALPRALSSSREHKKEKDKMEGSTSTIDLSTLSSGLSAVATAAVPIGVAALLVWAGFRLAAKLTNRGVGK